MARTHAVVLSLYFLLCAPAYAEPLIVGGDKIGDACPSLAMVKAKKYIFLRTSPFLSAPPVGKLVAGSHVYICTEKNGWIGVVAIDGNGATCGVSSPIIKKTIYKGPCRSGWIETRQIVLLAG